MLILKILSSCLTSKFQQRNLRRASIPDGQNHGSQATINVNLCISEATVALEHTLACAAQTVAFTPDCDLAAVRVSAEHEVN